MMFISMRSTIALSICALWFKGAVKSYQLLPFHRTQAPLGGIENAPIRTRTGFKVSDGNQIRKDGGMLLFRLSSKALADDKKDRSSELTVADSKDKSERERGTERPLSAEELELGYQTENFKSGFITILGNPNVGKSTLMNTLLGQKLCIVSPKPQTTRHRILGVVTETFKGQNYQMVFSDTPGMITPVYKLQEAMMESVRGAAGDADIVLVLSDVYGEELVDSKIYQKLAATTRPIIVVLNKVDLLPSPVPSELLGRIFDGNRESVERSADGGVEFKVKKRPSILRRKMSVVEATTPPPPQQQQQQPASAMSPQNTRPVGIPTDSEGQSQSADPSGIEEDQPSPLIDEYLRHLEASEISPPAEDGPKGSPVDFERQRRESGEGKDGNSDNRAQQSLPQSKRESDTPIMSYPELLLKWNQRLPRAEIIGISASERCGVDLLIERLVHHLPLGPKYFDDDTLTNRDERFFSTEIIREAILLSYKNEIPYSCEVQIESFKDKTETLSVIEASIVVSKQSQKLILIGKGGSKIKELGEVARAKLEEFLDRSVYLSLFVKVDEEWRSNEEALKKYGYRESDFG